MHFALYFPTIPGTVVVWYVAAWDSVSVDYSVKLENLRVAAMEYIHFCTETRHLSASWDSWNVSKWDNYHFLRPFLMEQLFLIFWTRWTSIWRILRRAEPDSLENFIALEAFGMTSSVRVAAETLLDVARFPASTTLIDVNTRALPSLTMITLFAKTFASSEVK